MFPSLIFGEETLDMLLLFVLCRGLLNYCLGVIFIFRFK